MRACECLDFLRWGGGEDRYAEAAWAGARQNHAQLHPLMPTPGYPRVDQDTPQETPVLDPRVLDTPVVVMNQAHTNPQRREHMEHLTRQMGWSNVSFPPTKKWSELDLDELIAHLLVPPATRHVLTHSTRGILIAACGDSFNTDQTRGMW